MPYKPSWFRDNKIIISNAPTCGINKDGVEQYKVDPISGKRSNSEVDDKLFEDATNLVDNQVISGYLSECDLVEVRQSKVMVPQYHDLSSVTAFEDFVAQLDGFTSISFRELIEKRLIQIRGGHGSPSSDQRLGDIPYIKVSDLRASHVNINSSNMIPLELAIRYWGGEDSGLQAYDLISPERASKNIGEFCVLMPGQERIVLTKEVLIMKATLNTHFDQFFLMWSLSLAQVKEQWRRIILMQTNREDISDRVLEIRIPFPYNKNIADSVSLPFKEYYQELQIARRKFLHRLDSSCYEHHIFLE